MFFSQKISFRNALLLCLFTLLAGIFSAQMVQAQLSSEPAGLTNPGFESALTEPFNQATNGTVARDTAEKKSGSYSLKHVATANNSYNYPYLNSSPAALIRAAEGDVIYFSAWAKANTNADIKLRLFCLNSSYANVLQSFETFTATTTWQEFYVTNTCPATTEYASIRLDNSISGNTVWWDDVTLQNLPEYDADVVSQSGIPTVMNAGSTQTVSVTVKNMGATTWTKAENYRLGSQNPTGNSNWGFTRVYLDTTDSILPGATKTFAFTITAPTTPGTYNFQWKMLRESVAWFGDQTTNVSISVVDPTPPVNPSSLTAQVSSVNIANTYIASASPTIDFSWPAATDPESGIKDYQIVLQRVSDSVWVYNPWVGNVTTYSLATSGLSSGESYYYWIRARNNSDMIANPFVLGGKFTIDATAPTQDALLVPDKNWGINGVNTYDVIAQATDNDSGILQMRILVNYQGSNAGNHMGQFAWSETTYEASLFSADRVTCSGDGGYAGKYPGAHSPETVTLLACNSSFGDNQRIVSFTLQPKASFGTYGAINDVSFYARDNALNDTGWVHHDINFKTDTVAPTITLSGADTWVASESEVGIACSDSKGYCNPTDFALKAYASNPGSCPATQDQNFVNNPGFESGQLEHPLLAANNATVNIDNTTAHSGQYSLQHVLSSTAASIIPHPAVNSPDVVVMSAAGGDVVDLSVWAKASTDTVATVSIFCLDENYDYTWSSDATIGQNFSLGTDWQQVQVSGTCPAGTDFASFRFTNNIGQVGGTIWWDDIRFTKNPIKTYDVDVPETFPSDTWLCGTGTDDAGNQGYSTPQQVRIDATAPTNPSNFTAEISGVEINGYVNMTNPKIDFIWTVGSDSQSGVKDYQIVLQRVNDGTWLYSPWVGNVTTYALQPTGLEEGADYHYWIRTRDNALNISEFFLGGTFTVDTSLPTHQALNVSGSDWILDNSTTYDVIFEAADTVGGITDMQMIINYQGSNSDNPRGHFSWRESGYASAADQVLCTGDGGYGSKQASGLNPSTVTLMNCNSTLSGNTRTVTFTILPDRETFGEWEAINDVSVKATDAAGNATAWDNYDVNFSTTKPLSHEAQFITQNVPIEMKTGETVPVTVTMKNLGINTWTKADNYKLGSVGDDMTWTTFRALLADADTIAQGQQKTFTFNITAPDEAGTYDFQWRMLQEGVKWFGSTTTAGVTINVIPTHEAQFISQTVPTEMIPGEDYEVVVTMKNLGANTWTKADNYHLGTPGTDWSPNRAELDDTDSIAQGQQKTFVYTVTAPSTPDTYIFEPQMLHEGVKWFGEKGTVVAVEVAYLTSAGSCEFDSTSFQAMQKGVLAAWDEACGGSFIAFLQSIGVEDEAFTGGRFLTSINAYFTPNTAVLPDEEINTDGSLINEIRSRINGYLCASELDSYDIADVITSYNLDDPLMNITSPPACL